ncbi:MAG TPA: NAD(P)/FAD-dependent oxidoreductase [Chitinophagales bacterium]|nr:NAD(P)/FAD-dependent oxidoreductase [Chitinophagales bacterium]
MANGTVDNGFYDVIVVGAGLSGIGAAYHLQTSSPGKTFCILEGRSSMGGTWDLFRYPGIRSDSDMYTLGFSFNLWDKPKAIADGPSILQYIKDTAAKFGIDKKIQYNQKVVDASWSDADRQWALQVTNPLTGEARQLRCNFLLMCSGYYDYSAGYDPAIPGRETFKGPVIHPQKWDESLNYEGKKVVIIGSGATAITLVPEMAKKAAKVTMLQRSPTYVVNLPAKEVLAPFLGKFLPHKTTYNMVRWKNILLSILFYKAARRWPNGVKKLIQSGVKRELGENYDIRNFSPNYKPWDQRLCVVPDNDLFHAIKEGKAEVVTDTIKQITPTGILLNSGKELEADIIVKATGLKVQMLGGMMLRLNGQPVQTTQLHCYRGVMLSGVPNFAFTIGYTNASWTLKCDLSCQFVTRVINYMDAHHYATCTPHFDETKFQTEPFLDFDAGYIKRAADILPRQGSASPWKVYQNYLSDRISLNLSSVNDGFLVYK